MRSKSIDRRFVIGVAASLLVIAAMAIEAPKPVSPPAQASQKEGPAEPPPSAPATEPPPTEGTEAAPAPAPAAVEEEEEALPPLPADALPAGPPPARFNPTEKVRADFPVSFPIDI